MKLICIFILLIIFFINKNLNKKNNYILNDRINTLIMYCYYEDDYGNNLKNLNEFMMIQDYII